MSNAPPPKSLVWLHGEVKSPPFSQEGRIEAGVLLRRLQNGELLGMPHCRAMSSIAPQCRELRIRDAGHNWRIIFRIDSDAILIVHVFHKATQTTPLSVINICRQRLSDYDRIVQAESKKRQARKKGDG